MPQAGKPGRNKIHVNRILSKHPARRTIDAVNRFTFVKCLHGVHRICYLRSSPSFDMSGYFSVLSFGSLIAGAMAGWPIHDDGTFRECCRDHGYDCMPKKPGFIRPGHVCEWEYCKPNLTHYTGEEESRYYFTRPRRWFQAQWRLGKRRTERRKCVSKVQSSELP